MVESDEELKEKFMEYVNSKSSKVNNSFTITNEKRDRVIRCLKNPQSEPSSKFRFWVRQKKFRLIQSEDGEGDIVGIPVDEKDGDEVSNALYKRAACTEEFFDLINTAHVENGHIGLSQTYAAIRRVYALLPRCIVAKFVQLCPICRRTSRASYTPRSQEPPSKVPLNRLVDGGSINRSELNQTITVVTTSGQLETFEGTEIITDGTLPASAISSIIGQEGLSNSDVIHEITLNQTEDGQTVAVVSETSAQTREEEESPHQAMDSQTAIVGTKDESSGTNTPMTPVVIFNCHICNKQFEKKLTYQRHLRTHSEHNPTMPVVLSTPPPAKRIKVERKQRNSTNQRRAIILDVDMSVDCVQGVMLAATRSDVDILAITCVSGSVNIEHTCNNALRVLKACNREDIPVFRGAEKPLVGEAAQTDSNLPGAAWESPADARQIEAEHAVSALIRFVNEYPGQITLVCLGPLTNLALALRLDPQVARKLKEICILGGNTEGRGNATPCAELNFYHDPEAAFIVLKEMSNITLLPHEMCQRQPVSGEFFFSYVHAGTVKSEFLRNSGDEGWLQQSHKNSYVARCAYAVAVAIDTSVALDTETAYATVELSGRMAHGMMIVDWSKSLDREPNLFIVKSLDLGKVQSFLLGMVQDELIAELVYTPC
ncbi:hypothetical protein V1264_022387 [Littorina saxatilis]